MGAILLERIKSISRSGRKLQTPMPRTRPCSYRSSMRCRLLGDALLQSNKVWENSTIPAVYGCPFIFCICGASDLRPPDSGAPVSSGSIPSPNERRRTRIDDDAHWVTRGRMWLVCSCRFNLLDFYCCSWPLLRGNC